MYENDISCTLNGIIRGWLCEVTYTNPLLPASFEKLFYSNQGGGGMAPCALSYASDGGTARICQQGAKARERSDRAGGGCGSPSHGREIFHNLCLKTAFSCTLDTIIRGSLCSGIDQFPTLVLFFILFLMNLFQGNIFLFPFFFLLFYSPINGGGGHGPLVHLSYSSNSGAAKICQRGQCEGAKRPSEGRVWEGGFPPPTVGRFFKICV